MQYTANIQYQLPFAKISHKASLNCFFALMISVLPLYIKHLHSEASLTTSEGSRFHSTKAYVGKAFWWFVWCRKTPVYFYKAAAAQNMMRTGLLRSLSKFSKLMHKTTFSCKENCSAAVWDTNTRSALLCWSEKHHSEMNSGFIQQWLFDIALSPLLHDQVTGPFSFQVVVVVLKCISSFTWMLLVSKDSSSK